MSQDAKMVMVNRKVFLGLKGFNEFTLDYFGELVGLDASNICRLVKGHRYIEREKAEILCRALNARVEDIFEEVRR